MPPIELDTEKTPTNPEDGNIFDREVPGTEVETTSEDETPQETPEDKATRLEKELEASNKELEELKNKPETPPTPPVQDQVNEDDPLKLPADERPWWIKGTKRSPSGWPEVVDFVMGQMKGMTQKSQEDTIRTIAEAIQTEQKRVKDEDTALEKGLSKAKEGITTDAGKTIKITDEQEAEVLTIHKKFIGEAVNEDSIVKAVEIWDAMKSAENKGTTQGQKVEQNKQILGQAAKGTTTPPDKKRINNLRTKSLDDIAAEVAESFKRS